MTITVPNPTTDPEDSVVVVPAPNPHFWVARLAATLEQLLEVVIDPDYPELLLPSKVELARQVWQECMATHPTVAAMVPAEVAELLSRDVTADEVVVAHLTGESVPVADLPERCDRCHGTDTHNPEGICDECMADLDSPAMDGGGF